MRYLSRLRSSYGITLSLSQEQRKYFKNKSQNWNCERYQRNLTIPCCNHTKLDKWGNTACCIYSIAIKVDVNSSCDLLKTVYDAKRVFILTVYCAFCIGQRYMQLWWSKFVISTLYFLQIWHRMSWPILGCFLFRSIKKTTFMSISSLVWVC